MDDPVEDTPSCAKSNPYQGGQRGSFSLASAGPPGGGRCHQSTRIHLCSYQAVSQGPANTNIIGLVQGVGKTHQTNPGQLRTGSYQCLGQAAVGNVEPGFAPVLTKLGSAWDFRPTCLQMPARCALWGSGLCHTRRHAVRGCLFPNPKDCRNSSDGRSAISRGRQGWGKEGE